MIALLSVDLRQPVITTNVLPHVDTRQSDVRQVDLFSTLRLSLLKFDDYPSHNTRRPSRIALCT